MLMPFSSQILLCPCPCPHAVLHVLPRSLSGIPIHHSFPYSQTVAAALGPPNGPLMGFLVLKELAEQLSDTQFQEVDAVFGGGHLVFGAAGGNHAGGPDSSDGDESEGSGSEAGSDDFGGSLGEEGAGDDAASSEGGVDVGGAAGSGVGCMEPGVLALVVQGPVVACIDSLGNILLRDYTAGVPGPEVLCRFCASPAQHAAASSGGGFGGGEAAGGSSASAAVGTGGEEFAERGTTPEAPAAAAEQLSKLKFWRQ